MLEPPQSVVYRDEAGRPWVPGYARDGLPDGSLRLFEAFGR